MTQQISAWRDAQKIMRNSLVYFEDYEWTIHSLSREEKRERAASLRGQLTTLVAARLSLARDLQATVMRRVAAGYINRYECRFELHERWQRS